MLRQVLAVVFLGQTGGLPVETDANLIDQRGRELIHVPDARILIAGQRRAGPVGGPPSGRPKRDGITAFVCWNESRTKSVLLGEN